MDTPKKNNSAIKIHYVKIIQLVKKKKQKQPS